MVWDRVRRLLPIAALLFLVTWLAWPAIKAYAEAGWEVSYTSGTGDPGTGPQTLTWTCPGSGTGAGTVVSSDPGNTLISGTYTSLTTDSGCDPEVGETLMFGFWTATIVSAIDPSPTTTTTTTVPPTTTTEMTCASPEAPEDCLTPSEASTESMLLLGPLVVLLMVAFLTHRTVSSL